MLGPSAREAAVLQFALGRWTLPARYAAAVACFVAGGALLMFHRFWSGLLLIAAGHAALWVKTQRLAPGGATPAHEQVWAPAEEGWLGQVTALEERGAAWDLSPWDISNWLGALLCAGTLLLLWLFVETCVEWTRRDEWLWIGALLLTPVWFNGIRTLWNPSELRIKGTALNSAIFAAKQRGGDRFDVVPLLALREGPRGKYPVDARVMLRPKRRPDGPFIGVQIQVSLNNVRGTVYPYLYCVILLKAGTGRQFPRPPGSDLVFEDGAGEGVRYLVVRQFADRNGGWHTGADAITRIVATALELTLELTEEQT